MDVFSIALSGLNAQSRRMTATASNVANALTSGPVPSQDPSAPASGVYKRLQTQLTPVTGGGEGAGVKATITEDPNGYSVVYDPNSAFANAEGMIAVPKVDLAQEAVDLISEKIAFKANLSVIKTEEEMLGSLLDIMA